MSRIHARVELDGWQVFITDLKSANGTEVLLPGDRNPTSLQPGVRLPLMAGTQIRLAANTGSSMTRGVTSSYLTEAGEG